MRTCAYCGRQLFWLHRVVDGYRYCCREHARLHRTAREEAARRRENHCAAGEPPPLESLPAYLDGTGHALGFGTVLSNESVAEAPLSRIAGRLVQLDAPPVNLEAAQGAAIAPAPEDLDPGDPVIRVIVFPGLEPAFPAPHAGLVPLALTPLEDRRRPAPAIRPLRPRRTVLAPAHRPAAPPAGLRQSGAVVAASWSAPLGELPQCSPETDVRTALGFSSQEPGSVLVFSFLEGAPPGAVSRTEARPLLNQRIRLSCGALMEIPAAAEEWRAADLLSGAHSALDVRCRWRPPAVLCRRRSTGLAPCPGIRTNAWVSLGLLDEHTAPVQPFRMHRMPLRVLQLRPVGAAAAFPPRKLAALNRMLFLKALHVPRASSMPYHPAYRLLPPPAVFAEPAQARGNLASYAANRRPGE